MRGRTYRKSRRFSLPLDTSSKPPEADRVVISVSPMARARLARKGADRLAELLAQRRFRAAVLTDLDQVA